MGINMEQVLQALAETENPEESFNAALQDTEKVASATPAVEEEVMETPETSEDEDLAKVAEADAQGRIMARAFHDELNKLAVAPVAAYPADPGALPNNPAVEMGRGEPAQRHQAGQSAANGLIAQLSSAGKVGQGEFGTPAGVQPLPPTDPMEGNQPLAADMGKMQERAAVPGADAVKTGALKITETLYNKYFGDEEEVA
ncbi:MAG: hypothetical protein H8D23_06590 [Candidatus Brocadiales bacterium]|nr:hypothetical protein [Candidatus Brocadiales bacterium]